MQGHVRGLSGVLSPPKATTSLQAQLHCASVGRDAPHPAALLHSLMQYRALNIYTQAGSENQEPASCRDGLRICRHSDLWSRDPQLTAPARTQLQAFAQLTLSQQIWLKENVNHSRT